jgi:hypothetical protein
MCRATSAHIRICQPLSHLRQQLRRGLAETQFPLKKMLRNWCWKHQPETMGDVRIQDFTMNDEKLGDFWWKFTMILPKILGETLGFEDENRTKNIHQKWGIELSLHWF